MTLSDPSVLTAGSDSTDGTSYVTASISPTAGARVLLFVEIGIVGTAVFPSGVAGAGLTWAELTAARATSASGYFNGTIFDGGVSDGTTGAITITVPSTMSEAIWFVVEVDGTAPIIAQSAGAASASTSGSVSLPSAASTGGKTLASIVKNSTSATIAPGAGFTAYGTQPTAAGPTTKGQFQYGSELQTAAWTLSNTNQQVMTVVEVVEDGAPAPSARDRVASLASFASDTSVTTGTATLTADVADETAVVVWAAAGATPIMDLSDSQGHTWTSLGSRVTTTGALSKVQAWSGTVTGWVSGSTITIDRFDTDGVTPLAGGLAFDVVRAEDFDPAAIGLVSDFNDAADTSFTAGGVVVTSDGSRVMLGVASTTGADPSATAPATLLDPVISTGTGNPRELLVAHQPADIGTTTPEITSTVGRPFAAVAFALAPTPISVADAWTAVEGDSLTERPEAVAPPTREATTRALWSSYGFTDARFGWYGDGGKRIDTADSNGYTGLEALDLIITALKRPPQILVAALGTNNTPDGTTAFEAAMRDYIDGALARGVRKILWPYLVYPAENNTNALTYNPVIEAVAGDYPEVTTLDLNTILHSPYVESNWLLGDVPHMTVEGYARRDSALAEAVIALTDAFIDVATLTGSGALTAGAAPTVAAAPALSGSGSLGATAEPAPATAPSLSGSGSLNTAAQPAPATTAALSGSGGLSATAAPTATAAPALSGSGALVAVPAGSSSDTASLAGSGALAAGASPKPSGVATLAGGGTLTTTHEPAAAAAVALSGSGALAASAGNDHAAAATLSGAGQLTTTRVPALAGVATLTGAGVLTTTWLPATSGAATLSGSGTLTATGSTVVPPLGVRVTGGPGSNRYAGAGSTRYAAATTRRWTGGSGV